MRNVCCVANEVFFLDKIVPMKILTTYFLIVHTLKLYGGKTIRRNGIGRSVVE